MRFAICNEMFKDWPHAKVAATVAGLGYTGIEIAPFTLGDGPEPGAAAARLSKERAREVRRAFEDAGVTVVGLHWLLARSGAMSITSEDGNLVARAADHMKSLIRLCRELGGELMVFGSPGQRSLAPGQDAAAAFDRVVWLMRDLALAASNDGVVICMEPLTPKETNFINTMAEGVRLVEAVDSPAFRLHLDVKAMAGAEAMPPAEVLLREGGKRLHHFHANDPNLLGPGMGEVDQRPIGRALKTIGYNRWVSVETFADGPGPEEIARMSMDSLKASYA